MEEHDFHARMAFTAGACDVCAVAGVGGVTAAIGVHFPRKRPAFNDVVVDRVRTGGFACPVTTGPTECSWMLSP